MLPVRCCVFCVLLVSVCCGVCVFPVRCLCVVSEGSCFALFVRFQLGVLCCILCVLFVKCCVAFILYY